MKAVLLQEPNKIGIKDIPEGERGKGEALIKVKAAGICGSDIGAFRGTNPLVKYPRIIGHEVAGEIIEIDQNDNGFKVGDHVILDPYLYCGECYPCSIGRTNCCENLKVIGVHIDGGMREYLAYPIDMLIKAPKDMPWEIIPMAEPLTIALHALHRTRFKANEYMAINGAGAIGILVALSAKAYGGTPILIDIVDERLEYAKKLGIEHTINIGVENSIEAIKDITKGRMAEVVVEASGANGAIRDTLDMASFAGRIALTGWPKNDTLIPTDTITRKELDLLGSRVSVGEFDEALKLITTGMIDVKPIISKIITLDDAPGTLIEQSENPDRYLKVIILF